MPIVVADQFEPQRIESVFHIALRPLMHSRKINQIGPTFDTATSHDVAFTPCLGLAKAVQVVVAGSAGASES
jgi:hypothetical protein